MAKRTALGGNVLEAVAGIEERTPSPAPAGSSENVVNREYLKSVGMTEKQIEQLLRRRTRKEQKAHEETLTTRQTYHMDRELVEKIRGVALSEQMTVSYVVNEAVRHYVERMEKKRGEQYAPAKEARKGRPIR